MIIKLLNGETDKISLRKYILKQTSKSAFQTKIGKILKKTFPYDIICEEVYIPKEKLYLDFLIPNSNLAIEVQGRQHTSFVKYFHKNLRGFNNQVNRDNRKRAWCTLNNIYLIEIFTTDTDQEILDKILGKVKP